MHQSPELRTILEHLVDGVLSHPELARLVQMCRCIAESHLLHHRKSLVRICALNGLSISDLASDCVADAFELGHSNNFIHFEKFLATLRRPLEETSEEQLSLAFASFVLIITKTQLARVYAQCDPAGAKILRNIKDALKNGNSLEIRHDFRGAVVYPLNVDALDHLPAYPIENLESVLCALRRRTLRIPVLLAEVSSLLVEQEEHRRSIPLIDLVQVFKSYYEQFLESSEVTDGYAIGLTEDDIKRLRKRTLQAIDEKIVMTYLLKGKIDKSEAGVLSATMNEIVGGWFDGGIQESSYYSLVAGRISISQEEYENTWRKKIEYLAKTARQTILDNLEGDV